MARHHGGWVKIHRKAILGDIGSNYTRSGLFGALVAMANLQESYVSWKGVPRKLQRGELVTSITELAELGDVDRSTVAHHLNYLALRETISIEKSNKGILIKFNNFDRYQAYDAESPHQSQQRTHIRASNGPSSEPPHNEELKNLRREEDTSSSLPSLAVIWNETTELPLPRVLACGDARLEAISKLLAKWSEEQWREACEKVDASEFLSARSKKWIGARFDWLLDFQNFAKVLEGFYDNMSHAEAGELWLKEAASVAAMLSMFSDRDWARYESEIRARIGDELFELTNRAGPSRMRELARNSQYLPSIASMLKDASQQLEFQMEAR